MLEILHLLIRGVRTGNSIIRPLEIPLLVCGNWNCGDDKHTPFDLCTVYKKCQMSLAIHDDGWNDNQWMGVSLLNEMLDWPIDK